MSHFPLVELGLLRLSAPSVSQLLHSSLPPPSHTCYHPFYPSDDFSSALLLLLVLRVPRFRVPDIWHQLLGRPFGSFPLFGDLWQSSRNVRAPPQDGGRGAATRSPDWGPRCAPGSRYLVASPRLALTSLSLSRPPAPHLCLQRRAPRLPSLRLSVPVKVPCPSPPVRPGEHCQGPLPRPCAPAARG